MELAVCVHENVRWPLSAGVPLSEKVDPLNAVPESGRDCRDGCDASNADGDDAVLDGADIENLLDDEDEGLCEVLAELELEGAIGSGDAEMSDKPVAGKHASKKAPLGLLVPVCKDSVVKLPLERPITRQGSSVFYGPTRVGTMSYLVHWSPAAVSANCLIHEDCFFTAPMLGEHAPTDDTIVQWLGEAMCFKCAADHVSHAPEGAYNRRRS